MRGKSGKFYTRVFIVLVVAIILAVGVFAQTLNEEPNNSGEVSDSEADTIADRVVSSKGLTDTTKNFIKEFVKKEKISEEEINSVEEVDLENPPEEVKLGDEIEDTNVAIYTVKYTKGEEDKKLYVVTYSDEQFEVPLEFKPATAIEYLSFGEVMETSGSVYLKTNTGVRSSNVKGYVMMDEGSITGISTNIEAVDGEGRIDIIVYVNGKDVGLRNLIYIDENGVKKDYDKQSKDIIKFLPGDVISVYVESQGGVSWKDAITLVKIELE